MKEYDGQKPRVGDLVTLDQLACEEHTYWGKEAGQVGVITRCVGIRCEVQWADGTKSRPERSVLEVINAAR